MRSRNIKPGFFKNEILGECDPLSRILFSGLWCMADREGRLEYRPKRIKIEILPYDDCDIEQLLGCLIKNGFLLHYIIGDNEYLAIVNWKKHQSPHVKEAASEIPAPDKHQSISGQAPDKHQSISGQAPDKHQSSTEVAALIPDSLNLIPITPYSPPRGDEQEIKKKEYSDSFEEFWLACPKKIGKDAAYRSWKKIGKNKSAKPREVIDAIISQVSSDHFKGNDGQNYFPNPSTWLNQGRWKDEIKPRASQIAKPPEPDNLDPKTRYKD